MTEPLAEVNSDNGMLMRYLSTEANHPEVRSELFVCYYAIFRYIIETWT